MNQKLVHLFLLLICLLTLFEPLNFSSSHQLLWQIHRIYTRQPTQIFHFKDPMTPPTILGQQIHLLHSFTHGRCSTNSKGHTIPSTYALCLTPDGYLINSGCFRKQTTFSIIHSQTKYVHLSPAEWKEPTWIPPLLNSTVDLKALNSIWTCIAELWFILNFPKWEGRISWRKGFSIKSNTYVFWANVCSSSS